MFSEARRVNEEDARRRSGEGEGVEVSWFLLQTQVLSLPLLEDARLVWG